MKNIIKIVLVVFMYTVSLQAVEKIDLQTSRQLAIAHNQQIKIAEENRLSTKLSKRAAFTQFLPRVDFLGNYTYSKKKITYETPQLTIPIQDMSTGVPSPSPYYLFMPSQTIELGQDNKYVLGLSITQPIFTGGKIVQQYNISRYMDNIARHETNMKKEEILIKVDELFWTYVSMTEKVNLAQEYKEMVNKHLEDLENYHEVGIITKNDVLKAKVEFSNAELQLLRAQNGQELSRLALCQLTGLNANEEIEPQYNLNELTIFDDLDSNVTLALQKRTEIDILENLVDVNKSIVKLNFSRYMPNLLLQADYINMRPNPYNSLEDEFGSDWFIGLTCQFDIFNWNERGFRYRAAKHRQTASELKLDEAKELILLEINKSLFKLNESSKRVQLSNTNLEQAEENLRVTKDNFSEGMVGSTEVIDAQTLWQSAFSENIDAKVEYKINKSKALKALGNILDQ